MGLFGAWANADAGDQSAKAKARAAIARGEALFNQNPLTITGVAGLNDALGNPAIPGTCSTCHNAPNVGNHTVGLPLDIGIADASRRTPDMPLYTLRNKATGETVQTTDPGLALITGKWADIGKFKGPVLRGLAARPPYFHNGSAARLEDVVDFYDTRFSMNLDAQEKQDLVAFLKAL
jgi:cytochrome c peroxidase